MRIGLVLDDTLDSTDGVQQYVLLVGQWLAKQGHEVHYLVGETKRTSPPNIHSLSRNITVAFNGNKMSMPLPANRAKLRRLLRTLQLDILHVQVPYSPFLGGQLIRLVPKTTAVVGTFHILAYGRLETWANRGLSVLNVSSGKRFDAMMATSQPAQDFARSIYGYHAEVVPNPVEITRFLHVSGPASTVLRVVFLGRLVERKGALQLLQAIAYIRRHRLYDGDFIVELAGKGVQLPVLQAFAVEHGLADIVAFPGFIDEADKPALLSSADVAVFPSISGESFGISVVEALAAARGVVIAGDNPGYRSVMSGLEGGKDQLVDPRDTPAFARVLALWLQDQPARGRAAKAQQQYAQHFDIAAVGARIEAVYEQALHKRH